MDILTMIIGSMILLGVILAAFIIVIDMIKGDVAPESYYVAQQDPNTGYGSRQDEHRMHGYDCPDKDDMISYYKMLKEHHPEEYNKIFKQ